MGIVRLKQAENLGPGNPCRQSLLTINVRPDLESAEYDFAGKISIFFFLREITTWTRQFRPLNCPERSEGQFRGQTC